MTNQCTFRPEPPTSDQPIKRLPVISRVFEVRPSLNSPDGSETDSRTEANLRITAAALQKTFQLQTDLLLVFSLEMQTSDLRPLTSDSKLPLTQFANIPISVHLHSGRRSACAYKSQYAGIGSIRKETFAFAQQHRIYHQYNLVNQSLFQ